jgi:outer membrane protein assembly factor BamB
VLRLFRRFNFVYALYRPAERRTIMGARWAVRVMLAWAVWGGFARGADWPFFRGPARDGKSSETNVPLEWSKTRNVKWKAKLPQPGNSSPIVVGDRVFLTCAEDKQGHARSLYCFNREDGKQLWMKTVSYEPIEPMHETNPYCASSPASDGERVVVWHGSAGLYCYGVDGKEMWKKDLGQFRQIWGYASSPVIHGDRVFLNCGPGVRSFVVALDKNSGEIKWQSEVPGGADDKSPETKSWIGSWSSAVVVKVGDQDQLLVFQQRGVNAHDLSDGRIIWTVRGTGDLAYTDVVVGEPDASGTRLAAALAGFGGVAIGFKITPGMSGDVTATHRLWQSTAKPPQRIGSGVIIDGALYMINEPGLIQCMDVMTGKDLWTNRVPRGSFWGSLVASGGVGRLYVTTQQGTTVVFAPDKTGWKELASNPLGEKSNSTPAISNGRVYVRTFENLWCIE